jgi:O-6-methylguanine DNA methyltransferase
VYIYSKRFGDAYFCIVFDDKLRIWSSSFSLSSEEEARVIALKGIKEPVFSALKEHESFASSTVSALRGLLNGKEVKLKAVLHFRRLPRWARSVLAAASKVPKGKVSTYKTIGNLVKLPPVVVGKALASNPFLLLVPCHRIIRSNGGIGGYQLGEEVKRKILEKELGKPI